MAIQMTREEYRKKYGVAPVVSNGSSIDTTPAPVRMTRAEYNELYGNKEVQGESGGIFGPAKEAIAGLKTLYGTGEGGYLSNIKEDISSGVADMEKGGIMNNLKGAAKIGLRTAGDTAGLIFAPIGAAIQATGINKATDYIAEKVTETKLFKKLIDTPEFQEFALTHPNAEEDFGRVMNLGLAALETGKIEPKTAISRTAKQIGDVNTRLQEIQKQNQINRDMKSVERLDNEILNIQNNYVKTRKANEFSSDLGKSSRRRIAETDVLVGSVDPNGIIKTKQKGGAIEKYRAMTIDGVEGVVRENLARLGEKVNLKQVENALTLEVYNSGLEGADLITAIKGIKKQISGLELRADEFGNILLEKIHDAKINETKNINYETPPETATYRKAVARAYKKIVEENSSFNTREVNTELSKYYKDIKTLENLDGRRVKGGRLGKYVAQIGGNITGSVVGGAIGGLPGAAVGGVVGGELSSVLKGKQMEGTFGSARGLEAPKNPILEKARVEGKLPAKVDLKTPDVVVGAPKGIVKTKEVFSLENQIKRNVESQKMAIRSGDFTLVATLKEIYQQLVIRLREIIRKIKETPNKKGGFARNPFAREPKSDTQTGTRGEKGQLSSKDTTIKPKTYQGERDITTKILKDLEGKTTVSKQYILDATNRSELKQVERDLIRRILDESSGGIKVFSGASEITPEWRNDRISNFGTIFRGRNELGGGIYVTDSPAYAKTFGSKLTESSLNSKLNLFDIRESSANKIGKEIAIKIKKAVDNYDWYLKNGGEDILPTDVPKEVLNKIQNVYGANSTDILKKAGFDGIIGEESRISGQGGTVWNIFDAKNIKTYSSDTINVSDFAKKVKAELLP